MNAFCFGLYKDSLYFGAEGGIVYLADNGTMDLTAPITANAQQSWNMFESPVRKHVTAVRPLVEASGASNYTFTIGFDYGNINIQTSGATPGGGSPWDTSPWDISPWSPPIQVSTIWHASGGTWRRGQRRVDRKHR